MAHVSGQAHALAAEIDSGHGKAELSRLAVDWCVALAVNAVEAQTDAVVGAEATAHVDMRADLAVRGIRRGDLRERLLGRAFRHDIDRAADRAAGGYSVQERVGASEDLHTLDDFRRNELPRQDAVHAAVSDIVVVHREAPYEKRIGIGAERFNQAHRRIVLNYVADGSRLLVLDELLRVRLHVERVVEEVLVAQEPGASSAAHLTSGIRWWQRGWRDRWRSLHFDFRQRLVLLRHDRRCRRHAEGGANDTRTSSVCSHARCYSRRYSRGAVADWAPGRRSRTPWLARLVQKCYQAWPPATSLRQR